MIKIIDYDHSVGLTHGLEDGKDFIIKGNVALNELNYQAYTFNRLLDHKIGEVDYKDMDMFVACPDFGDRIGRRGASNFSLNDLNICLGIISLKIPDYILIAVSQSAITYLQIENRVTETYEGIPTNDFLIGKLKDLGYTSQFFTIDPVSYRLPQHKIIGLYFAAKNELFDKPIKMPDPVYDKKESSVCRWLSGLEGLHMNFHDPDWSKKEICAEIAPGSNAKKTSSVSVTSGYIRLRPDLPAPYLGLDFYKVSSSGPSIHPVHDRPLTLREGARLSGLLNQYTWPRNAKKRDVAKQIDLSVSPILGMKIKEGLLNVFG